MKPEYRMRRANGRIFDQMEERAKPKISLKQIFYKSSSKKTKKKCPKGKKVCKCK